MTRAPLTERELDVLEAMGRGMRNQDIAELLGIAINTVKAHARRIYLKMDATGRMHAVAIAREERILR